MAELECVAESRAACRADAPEGVGQQWWCGLEQRAQGDDEDECGGGDADDLPRSGVVRNASLPTSTISSEWRGLLRLIQEVLGGVVQLRGWDPALRAARGVFERHNLLAVGRELFKAGRPVGRLCCVG